MELSEGRGKVKPAEQPRQKPKGRTRTTRLKLGSKAVDSKGGPRQPGRSNFAGRGPRAGPQCYLGKFMQGQHLSLSNASNAMFHTNPDYCHQLPSLKWISFVEKCFRTSLPHHNLASPVETEHAAMAGLPTPPSRKISDFRKYTCKYI